MQMTRSVLMGGHRNVDSRSIVTGVNLPYFVGPGTDNSDFNMAGMGAGRRVRPTLRTTFGRSSSIVVRTFVSNVRLTGKYCGAGGGRIMFPVARMIDRGRFFSCGTGCGNRIARVAPTHLDPRLADHIRRLASTVCSVLKYGNVIHISCVVARNRGVGVLRVGAAPKVATADFVPRRMQTTNLSVGSIVASVVRSRFGWFYVFKGGGPLGVVGVPTRFSSVHPCAPRRLPRVFRRLLSSGSFRTIVRSIVPGIPLRVVTTRLHRYGAGLSMRGTFFRGLLRSVVRRRDSNFSVSTSSLPSGGRDCAFVSGRQSVILSPKFLSMNLLSGNFPAAMRVTVKSGLLVCP